MSLGISVPPSWKLVHFGELSLHSAFGPRFSSNDYADDGDIATLRTTDLSDDGRISYDTMPLAKLDGQFAKHFLQKGDLVITRSGTCGIAAVFMGYKMPVLPGAFLIRFRLRADANSLYYRYFFNSPLGRGQVLSTATGAVQQNLNITNLEKLVVPYPPFKSQNRIVAVLSAYDDLIENNTRRIAILEAIARAIYRDWFVEFRFPGHEKVKLVDSPLGKIPEGWNYLPLSKVADVNALSIKNGKEPEEVNYVDIASVSTGKIDEVRLLSFLEAPSRARRIVRHGDIIWSTVRPNRKSYSLILKPLENMVASTGFAVISGTKAPFTYLYHALTTEEFVGYLVNHATGSAYPAVNSGDFEKATILVPTQNALVAFHAITEPMFLAKHCMVEKDKKLRESRDLLLPKLISGQLDVEDLNIEAAEPLVEAEA